MISEKKRSWRENVETGGRLEGKLGVILSHFSGITGAKRFQLIDSAAPYIYFVSSSFTVEKEGNLARLSARFFRLPRVRFH